MPQLAKGGKHVFGWSIVGEGGDIPVPPEVMEEYGYLENEKLVIISGSRTSGGFSLIRIPILKGSRLFPALISIPGLLDEGIEPADIHEMRGRLVGSVRMSRGGRFLLGSKLMSSLGITSGERLLLARGSGLGIGFIARGPIFELAKGHPELITFNSSRRGDSTLQ